MLLYILFPFFPILPWHNLLYMVYLTSRQKLINIDQQETAQHAIDLELNSNLHFAYRQSIIDWNKSSLFLIEKLIKFVSTRI